MIKEIYTILTSDRNYKLQLDTNDEIVNANIANPVETEVNLGESNEKETSDAIDHVSDAAINVLKKLNPAFDEINSTEEQKSSGGDL